MFLGTNTLSTLSELILTARAKLSQSGFQSSLLFIYFLDDRNRTDVHTTKVWLKPYCWFSHDVTKIQTKKTIDPTENLLSPCVGAAEN